MQHLRATPVRVGIASLAGLVVVALIVALAWRPRSVVSIPTASPNPMSQASPDSTGTPGATRVPTHTPTVTPTAGPCELRESLPPAIQAGDAPTVAPQVEASDVSIIFASHLYDSKLDGPPVVRDDALGDWAMGLWFVPPGATEPTLLSQTTEGMVLPLGLSPSGDTAAVWWLPERRALGESSCLSGIYLLSTSDGTSQLLISGDWTIADDAEDDLDNGPIFWRDPHGISDPRTYLLPEVSFSADGRHFALIDNDTIGIYLAGETEPRRRHVGGCRDWAWSSEGEVFVAGCEDMTSAWYVDAGEGFAPQSVAIPSPEGGWGFLHDPAEGRAIGVLPDGRIRVSRFHGFATGCESPGCTLAPLGWSITTIDPDTGAARFVSEEVDFLVDAYERDESHLAGDASWVYAQVGETSGRFLRFESGTISKGPLLGTFAGGASDGSLLYGMRFDEATARALVFAFDADGNRSRVATIAFPDGATSTAGGISTPGIRVVPGR